MAFGVYQYADASDATVSFTNAGTFSVSATAKDSYTTDAHGEASAIGVWQRGQCDPGVTIERPSGMRAMQTFRKLPITMPKRKKKKGITRSTVPQPSQPLNQPRFCACRMPNGKACLGRSSVFVAAAF